MLPWRRRYIHLSSHRAIHVWKPAALLVRYHNMDTCGVLDNHTSTSEFVTSIDFQDNALQCSYYLTFEFSSAPCTFVTFIAYSSSMHITFFQLYWWKKWKWYSELWRSTCEFFTWPSSSLGLELVFPADNKPSSGQLPSYYAPVTFIFLPKWKQCCDQSILNATRDSIVVLICWTKVSFLGWTTLTCHQE